MTGLPVHIEAYLLETGFSGTEIFVLKHLIAGDCMTLRELASKTGKSTGVLDQATRKLMQKKILTREMVNGVPKFVLGSLESVKKWVQTDMSEKKDALERKQNDFERFISSLEVSKTRPDMEYFEGLEGGTSSSGEGPFTTALKKYFKGEKIDTTKLPFHFEGTELQKKVWKELLKIPYGKTRTYSDIATRIGHPTAVRAVATAVGKNPFCILVPCHRVVPKSGGVGKYAYGSKKKEWLLKHEGAI